MNFKGIHFYNNNVRCRKSIDNVRLVIWVWVEQDKRSGKLGNVREKTPLVLSWCDARVNSNGLSILYILHSSFSFDFTSLIDLSLWLFCSVLSLSVREIPVFISSSFDVCSDEMKIRLRSISTQAVKINQSLVVDYFPLCNFLLGSQMVPGWL